MSVFDSYNDSKDDGSAKTKGGYVIDIDGEIARVHLDIKVIKSGIDGSAHGAVYLIGQEPSGKFIVLGPTLSETVGAKFPEGINDESDQTEFRAHAALFQDPSRLLTWYLGIGASESHGFPRSIPDLKEAILDQVEFIEQIAGIAVGASLDVAGIKFVRTSIR
ncbi:hypothetical protein [Brevibacillus laterosporus]|uniref:Uncharacterized protein n=1 Tax=Brevibacillus laterosporus TaxID=1465 RepID=A0AAP3GAQ4_BRELA|nr:hypothetical protein [Brevibacillus laterosporus]MCR8978659.1 hypothetical protein [Brevibacillus laterosporus]MCZ0805815.1 hypothetical protein [Brevibacillus laterosporus]MCZ0824419.1 hypothetical protein [Brevibacillus laterosporus]MCZ0848323.1 hypothetical protein [Brevibacillus laterosporus]